MSNDGIITTDKPQLDRSEEAGTPLSGLHLYFHTTDSRSKNLKVVSLREWTFDLRDRTGAEPDSMARTKECEHELFNVIAAGTGAWWQILVRHRPSKSVSATAGPESVGIQLLLVLGKGNEDEASPPSS
jgi:hypothetical protein